MFTVQRSAFNILPVLLAPAWLSAAGPSVAINDPELVFWAGGFSGLVYGANVTSGFQTPAKALGPATGNVYDIVSLGEGGCITMDFPGGLADGPGWDFAVFENAFGGNFLELAFVEVSSDGVNWVRFPTRSETASPVGAFGTLDPALLDGFAGLHPVGQGTVFDLASLVGQPGYDKLIPGRVRQVRLVDIMGDGREHDTAGRPIYDPYLTQGSAGFDLEAVGTRYPAAPETLPAATGVSAGNLTVGWNAVAGARYVVETSDNLADWTVFQTLDISVDGAASVAVPMGTSPRLFTRVGRVK